jgi:sugar phosphate isomerase/epimerase
VGAVEIGLTSDGSWEIETSDLVTAVRTAGFSALGVGVNRVDDAAADAFRRAGLHCHELLALVISDNEEKTLESARRLADAAPVIGARWVLTVFRTGLSADSAKLINRCASMFAEAGAGMAVEFSPLGPVDSLQHGLDVVTAAGAGQAGLMIDSWHFSFSKSTWDDLAAVPLERIAYLQFTDAARPVSQNLMEETMQRRQLPGEGFLELERFATTFLERGFEGIVSVEVLNSELRALSVPEFARRAYEATAPYWS